MMFIPMALGNETTAMDLLWCTNNMVQHPSMLSVSHIARRFRPQRSALLLFLLANLVWSTIACVQDAPGTDECTNLREIHASANATIVGNFGDFDAYGFEPTLEGSARYRVVPPDTSPCARDIAAKLEAACRICDQVPRDCHDTVQRVLDEPTENCGACGNDVCEPGEDPLRCPEDCRPACGDGRCDGTESYQSCPADCGTGCGN